MQQASIIMSDTSVIINFLRINRMDLLAALNYKILITDHVKGEVLKRFSEQYQLLTDCLGQKSLTEVFVNEVDELSLFNQLISKVGRGESSAIAYAIRHQCALAIDDTKAIKEAKAISSNLI